MKTINHHYMAACLILIIAGVIAHDRVQGARASTSASALDIPYELNGYYGENIQSGYGYYYNNPLADKKILRVYKNKKDHRELYLFLGYWENQTEEKRIIAPRYTTDGWSYYWIKSDLLSADSLTINLKKFLNEKGFRKELVYYCYIIGDETTSSEYGLKIKSMVNLLLRGRNSAVLMRVAMLVTDEWPLERAEVYEEAFIKEMVPLLMRSF